MASFIAVQEWGSAGEKPFHSSLVRCSIFSLAAAAWTSNDPLLERHFRYAHLSIPTRTVGNDELVNFEFTARACMP